MGRIHYDQTESYNNKSDGIASQTCNIASRYKCKVEFMYNDDTAANAKSVLSVLGACVKSGDEIELICDGEDEEEAMKAMMDAVESGLGE